MTTSPYLPYAGIGSRSTPTHIQRIMRMLGAHLASEGWTLRSGGANGADAAFEVGVDDFLLTQRNLGGDHYRQQKEIYLPWAGFNNNPSQLYPANIPFSEDEVLLSRQYHPAWDRCSPSAKLLHQRNLRQLVGHQSVCGDKVQLSKFVICWTEGGQMKGGTSQALRIAFALDIPVFNLGLAADSQALELLLLNIEELQDKFKKEATDASQVSSLSNTEAEVGAQPPA